MSQKILAQNRKAFHDFSIDDRYEAGIALVGTEVKSLRQGKANLGDGWVDFVNGEAILKEVHISPYSEGNRYNPPEKRDRKLLLKKNEIARLIRDADEKGFTVVPLKIHLKDRWIKVEIAVAKGKKQYDKRESKKQRDAERAMARAKRRG